MTLSTKKEIEQTWGSHKPVLYAIAEVMKPERVIECGCGEYSTPILHDCAEQLHSIEHDVAWARKMQKKFPATEKHQWTIHPFGSCHNGIRRPDLTPEELAKVDHWYEEELKIAHVDFLFVDTFACARVPAFINLSPFADLVVLHDLEPNSPEFYCYELLEDAMVGWYHYRFAPEGYIAKVHRIPWTDIFSYRPLPLELLQRVVDCHAKKLWGFTVELEEVENGS